MESIANVMLLDADGHPLDPDIQAALRELLPRFRYCFLTLRDECLVTEIFEEAGRRLLEHESAYRAAKNPGGYAWRTLHNVAVTRLRHSSMRLERATFGSQEGELVIASLTSRDGPPSRSKPTSSCRSSWPR
jgi:DNA-directed RNA polymerase specialized sigma24 family protein